MNSHSKDWLSNPVDQSCWFFCLVYTLVKRHWPELFGCQSPTPLTTVWLFQGYNIFAQNTKTKSDVVEDFPNMLSVMSSSIVQRWTLIGFGDRYFSCPVHSIVFELACKGPDTPSLTSISKRINNGWKVLNQCSRLPRKLSDSLVLWHYFKNLEKRSLAF